MRNLRLRRPSPALVVAIVALVVAMGGTAYAGFSVPKNSVGSKQLKKNAVTTKKIKNGAVTAAKINTTGLTVPNALHANSADSATNAGTANLAHNIDGPEGIHVIGASGQPAFQNGCSDLTTAPFQPVGFFKDKEGIVHLQGVFTCPAANTVAFQLPAGYLPTPGTAIVEPANGGSSGAALLVIGSGISGFPTGAVEFSGTTAADTSGGTFRPGA